MKHFSQQLGFTLVELLLYLGLLSGFLLVLTDIFVSSLNVQKESESVSEVAQDGQYLLARLTYDAGQAQDITIPAAIGEMSETLSFSIGGVIKTYALNAGVLSLTSGGSTAALNGFGTNISNFSATKIGNPLGKPTVQIGFTVTSKIVRPEGQSSQTFQTTVGVR